MVPPSFRPEESAMPIRRRTALAALLSPGIARAQGWPMRPIRLTVPFPPGGAADVAARLLAEALAPLGAPWVIDNRPGGNTAIGAEAVARSAPDGHSFLFCSNSTMASVPLLMASPPYDPARDFAAVALVSRAPFFLFVPASLGITDVAGFLALARAQPGALTYGSNGNGTAGHLGMEWLKQATGIDLLHVPYRSYVLALNDMLGGRIQAMLADLTVVAGAVEAGRVRALAAAVPERSGFFAELPRWRRRPASRASMPASGSACSRRPGCAPTS
jgi:tripartite-type tricarboxylate transporter receptor subunit TctC